MRAVPASDPAVVGTPRLSLRSRTDIEDEVRRRVEAERKRLLDLTAHERDAVRHFRRPVERPFTAAERDRDHPDRRAHMEARCAAESGVRVRWLPRAGDARSGRGSVPAWQRVREQRTVQSDVLHGGAPHSVSAGARGAGHVAAGHHRSLRVLHGGIVRAVPFRDVRSGVSPRGAKRRL